MSMKPRDPDYDSSETEDEESNFFRLGDDDNDSRKRRRTTKEGAMLGVFGSDEDEPAPKRKLRKSFVGFVKSEPEQLDITPQEPPPKPESTPSRPSAFGASGAAPSSFAARMMAKMGYKEGQGLGKEGQGRSSIIEVTARPQGVGLGAVKEKSKQEREQEKRFAALRGEKIEEEQPRKTSGRSSGASTPRRPKTKYQTLGDIQKAAPGLQIPENFAKILDLTGPGQRMITTGELTPTSQPLVRRARNDLVGFVEEWKSLEERNDSVELDLRHQQQLVDTKQQVVHEMQDIATSVKNLGDAIAAGQWDPVYSALLKLKPSSELSTLAVAAIHPFLRQAVEGWQPLEDPKLSGYAVALYELRHLLGVKKRKISPYESMMLSIWLPKVRSAIASWNVYDPAPLILLLQTWDPLLPSIVRAQVVDGMLFGKIHDAVTSWNPKKKRDLPHTWLFPWLPYLPAHHLDPKDTGVVGDVRRKFRTLVDSWDYRQGVVPGLEQWRDVLRDAWTPLLLNHVIPALARFLRRFEVAPQDQEPYLSILDAALKWEKVVGSRALGQVLVDVVFPKWFRVLQEWLTTPGVNYEEVGQWMEWWRDLLPASLALESQWDKGLAMINAALDGEAVVIEEPKETKEVKEVKVAPVEVTFRNVVEDWCMEHDLQFLPQKGQLDAGGPVYRVTDAINGRGGVLVVLKGDVLWVLGAEGKSRPVGLGQELLELSSRR